MEFTVFDYLSKNEKIRFISFLEKTLKMVDDTSKEHNKLKKETYKDIDMIATRIITEFYEDYERSSYDPTGSLYEMYRIYYRDEDDEWEIKYSPDFTTKKHRVSNDYIFENSFVQGYHGGADKAINFKGKPHPSPGIPYYKNAKKNFLTWLGPAEKSESPMKLINIAIREPISNFKKKINVMSKRYSRANKELSEWVKLINSRLG